MITEITMPKDGMDMTEGVLVKWLKNEGDAVELEEPLFVIETDKITMESESPAKGIFLKKLYNGGETVPVFTVLGYIGEPGDKIPEVAAPSKAEEKVETKEQAPIDTKVENDAPMATSVNGVIPATPHARQLAKEKGIDLKLCRASGKAGEVTAKDVEDVINGTTPLARAMLAEKGSIEGVTGTGFGGKITKDDVLGKGAPVAATPAFVEMVDEKDSVTSVPMSGMRKVIAKRMCSSSTNVPPVTQSIRVDVTDLLALREKLNVGKEKADKITVNDFIVKAVGIAIAKHERFRMSFAGDHFDLHSSCDVGVAVSIDEGLLVPVVRSADKLCLTSISSKVKELAKKAKSNGLKPDECGNARITISNLGMYGIYSFTPMVNEPEAAIVGVCATEDVPAVENGQLVVKKKMMICVTYDHRVLNGSEVAEFEKTLRELLENPFGLLLWR